MGEDARLPAGTVLVCPVHVGRAPQVAALCAAATAPGPGGRLLLVSGEPGIGKTRLAAEVAVAARARGMVVLSGTCHRGSAVPYEPVVALLRRRLRGLDRGEVREVFQGPPRLASALLPELAEALSPISAAEVAPDHVDAAVVELLVRLAGGRPALLILEDLHWAGSDTVRLLTHLVREVEELPLRVLLTHRSHAVGRDHPLAAVLAEARRRPGRLELALAPLGRESVGEMVRAILEPQTGSDELVAALEARSGGNPLFVEELCKLLAERGDLGDGADAVAGLELPETVLETVLSRVDDLDEPTRQLLLLAAVAGDVVEPELVAYAAEVPVDAVEAAVGMALERGLLVERRGTPPAYHFRHALIREALAGALRGPARRRAHGRVGAAMAALLGAREEAAGAQADHLAAAGAAIPACAAARRAARHAARRGAWGEVEHRFRQARALAADDPTRLGVDTEAAEVLRSASPDAALRHVASGRPLATELGDTVALSRLATVEGLVRWWQGDGEGSVACQRQAHRLVEGRGDAFEMRPLLELARYHANRDEGGAADPLVERGIELLAVGVGSRRDRADLGNIRAVLARDDAEVERRYDEALAAAEAAGDEVILGVTLGDGGLAALWYLGDLRRARRWLGRAEEGIRMVRPGHAVAYRAAIAWVDAVAGDLDAAAASALPLITAPANVPAQVIALLALVEVGLRRADLDDAQVRAAAALALAERFGEAQWIVPAVGAVARVRARDRTAEAVALGEEALRRGQGRHWSFSPDIARALAAGGEIEALRAWAARVAAATVAAGSHRHDVAALHLCAGLRDLGIGDVAGARAGLSAAVDLYRALPCPAREAEAGLALAQLEDAAGGRAATVAAASSARALGERLQSPPLVAEAAALLRRAGVRAAAGGRARGAPEAATPLSAREADVAGLIAQGCSNAEIGRRLFLSERTVESHVSHILAKLDLGNRREVARWAESGRRAQEGSEPGPSSARALR